MYLSLDEKRCIFYAIYCFIISLCNLTNLSIVKINSLKFSIKIQSRKKLHGIRNFQTCQTRTFVPANISVLKVIELSSFPVRVNSFTAIFNAFYQLSRATNDHLQMFHNSIIRQTNKVFLLKSLSFMSCVGEVK